MSYLPKSSLACSIPLDRKGLEGRAAAGGGHSSLEGIQVGMAVEMVPLCPQRTTRLSSLGEGRLVVGVLVGPSGGRRGVVVRVDCGGLSGGFSSGRASLNPGLRNQAEEDGVFSRRTLVMYARNASFFA